MKCHLQNNSQSYKFSQNVQSFSHTCQQLNEIIFPKKNQNPYSFSHTCWQLNEIIFPKKDHNPYSFSRVIIIHPFNKLHQKTPMASYIILSLFTLKHNSHTLISLMSFAILRFLMLNISTITYHIAWISINNSWYSLFLF